MAERLAAILELADEERVTFLKVARAEACYRSVWHLQPSSSGITSLLSHGPRHVPSCGDATDWTSLRDSGRAGCLLNNSVCVCSP